MERERRVAYDRSFPEQRCSGKSRKAEGQSLQAIAISAFGGLECLMLVDLPALTCGPNQVIVNVQAAGVGMWDVKVRQGRVVLEGQQFPLVLGWESAGIIQEVGEEIADGM